MGLRSIFPLFFTFIGLIFGQKQFSNDNPAIQTRSLLVSRNGQPQLEQRVQASALKPGGRILGSRSSTTTLRPTTTTNHPTLLTTPHNIQREFTGKPGCQVDIVLLVDMSGGALNKRERYLALASELVRALDIGEFAAKMALVRYSGKGRTDTVFRLKNKFNQTVLLNELENAQPLGGTTRTKEAMLHARREFEHKFGGRDKADRVMIVFTDGYSQDDPAEIAPELRRERIHVYAVAVEDKEVAPNGDQLKAIASDPQSVIIGAAQFANLKNKVAQSRCR